MAKVPNVTQEQMDRQPGELPATGVRSDRTTALKPTGKNGNPAVGGYGSQRQGPKSDMRPGVKSGYGSRGKK